MVGFGGRMPASEEASENAEYGWRKERLYKLMALMSDQEGAEESWPELAIMSAKVESGGSSLWRSPNPPKRLR